MTFDVIVWLLDDREIRQSAMSAFLEDWVGRRSADLRNVTSVSDIAKADKRRKEICILIAGGTSLIEPTISRTVQLLLDRLDGRPLVIVTDIDTDEETTHALQSGADAIIPTSLKSATALAALDFVLSGGTFFPNLSLPRLTHAARISAAKTAGKTRASDPGPPSRGEPPKLTPRQLQVLEFIKKGRPNKEIARELDISDTTVKVFVRQLFKKFRARNRTQVALMSKDILFPSKILFQQPKYKTGSNGGAPVADSEEDEEEGENGEDRGVDGLGDGRGNGNDPTVND